MPAHSTITDPNIHEPKGVATATNGQVYIANGSGSGAWATTNKLYALVIPMEDISVTNPSYIVAPFTGTLTKIHSVISGAIAGADAVLTASIDGTPVTDGVLTITQSGSAAGDMDQATPTANNTVSAGSVISVASDGGPSSHVQTTITLLISHE